MTKKQQLAIGIPTGIVLGFLVLSAVTGNWKFFLWSLLPSFMTGMITLFGQAPRT